MKNISILEIFIFLITQTLVGCLLLLGIVYFTDNYKTPLLPIIIIVGTIIASTIIILAQQFLIGLTRTADEPNININTFIYTTLTIFILAGITHTLSDNFYIRAITGTAFLPFYMIPIAGWFIRTNTNRNIAYQGIYLGMVAIFVTATVLSIQPLITSDRTLQIFLTGPIIEELCKIGVLLLGLRTLKKTISVKQFVTVGIMVGLGFSIIEDYSYLANGIINGDWYLAYLFRALSIPLHSVGPGLVAYFYARNQKGKAIIGALMGLFIHMAWNGTALSFDAPIQANPIYYIPFAIVMGIYCLIITFLLVRMADNKVWK